MHQCGPYQKENELQKFCESAKVYETTHDEFTVMYEVLEILGHPKSWKVYSHQKFLLDQQIFYYLMDPVEVDIPGDKYMWFLWKLVFNFIWIVPVSKDELFSFT